MATASAHRSDPDEGLLRFDIGFNADARYGGEYIGADPVAFDQTRTVGCQVFIDGALSYGDYAPDGNHHDVNCLRTLPYDYYPHGVQGRAL